MLSKHPWVKPPTKEALQKELGGRNEIFIHFLSKDISHLKSIETEGGALKELANKAVNWKRQIVAAQKKIEENRARAEAEAEALSPRRQENFARTMDGRLVELFFDEFKKMSADLSPEELAYAETNAEKLEGLARRLDLFPDGDARTEILGSASSEALGLVIRHPVVSTATKETIQKELDRRKAAAE